VTIDRARFGSGAPDKSLLRVPQRSVLADEVYEILKESLRSHQIAPGQRLNLDQLARELHVSNTPVRQALARLEADGLVTKEPYRGFRATQLLDSHTIAELYDYRLLIEPACAARAARRGDAVRLSELQSLCEAGEIRRLIADADDHEAIGLRDVEFHLTICTSAGNSVVTDNLAAALTRMQLYTVYDRHGAGEEAWDEHRQILAAIKDGDPDGAASAMRTHLLNGLERLRAAVR
jgi:DNA-binding GntR family transcriptional regulator